MAETKTDDRVVVESFDSMDEKDYVSAIICRDMDEAVEIIAQARMRRPFEFHKLRRLADPVPEADED